MLGQAKHKILGKFVFISFKLLIDHSGLDSLYSGEVLVQHHTLFPDGVNKFFDFCQICFHLKIRIKFVSFPFIGIFYPEGNPKSCQGLGWVWSRCGRFALDNHSITCRRLVSEPPAAWPNPSTLENPGYSNCHIGKLKFSFLSNLHYRKQNKFL